MSPRLRCPSCGRLTIPTDTPGIELDDTFSVAVLEPHMKLLLKAAEEFDDGTPAGEHYTAVDFVDVIALSVAREMKSGKRKYSIPAGKPAGKRKKAA